MIGGLETVEHSFLEKEAMGGSQESNLHSLIQTQAYDNLVEKFPELTSIVLGVSIIETIDENTVLAGVKLAFPTKSIIIPAIYNGGQVDSTTFIYSEDDDILLGLTKKIVKILSKGANTGIDGEVGTPGIRGTAIDKGNIHKLFVPPRTYSSKIASDSGLLYQILEQSPELSLKLLNKCARDVSFRKVIQHKYGDGLLKTAKYVWGKSELIKKAKDNTPYSVKFSVDSIRNSNWLEKNAAIKEYYLNGFAISHGKHTPKHSLVAVQNTREKILQAGKTENFETLGDNKAGFFYMFDKDGDVTPLVVAPDMNNREQRSFLTKTKVNFQYLPLDNKRALPSNLIVKRVSESSIPYLKVAKKEDFAHKGLGNNSFVYVQNVIIIDKSGEPVALFDGCGWGTSKEQTATSNFHQKAVISWDSYSPPKVIDGIIYTGGNYVRILPQEKKGNLFIPVTSQDLLKTAEDEQDTVTLISDSPNHFIYKRASYNLQSLVRELVSESIDKVSISSLIKEARDNEGKPTVMKKVDSKIDQLIAVVTNLAGQVQNLTEGLSTALQPQIPEVAPEETELPIPDQSQATIPPQPTQPSYIGQGVSNGLDPMVAPQQQMVDPQQQMVDPQQQMVDPQQQMVDPQQQESLTQDGMNPSVDASLLEELSRIKDTKIMDLGVLATLASADSMGEVIAKYRDDVQIGASALARMLLNLMTKKTEAIAQIGEGKYNQIMGKLKPMLLKMTDLYAEIYYLKVESDASELVG